MVIRKAFMTSLPVMAGYIVLGTGFGILLRSAGYGTLWALAMSLFIYAGSMQFVGVSLITGAASVLTTAVTTIMINARHLFYSISMISRYKDAGKVKPYLIFALTDETYTLLSDGKIPEGADPDAYRFLVSFFDHCYWVLGSVLGSFAGEFLPFDSTGIEFSMTALFTASFVEQWLSAGSHLPALTGLLSTALCLVLFGPENFLIPSMILITVILSALRGRIATPESRKSDGRREEK
ncbi:MAG: AzlC family ABC transporter permease [Lachnospiraceae bacterium]|nr:AzlC family ABC transporter permease [Lachnospiraceae bacterium]